MTEDPQSADGWTPDTSQGFPADVAWEIGRELAAADRRSERFRELTDTGRSVRYTGRPIMTMIAEALGPVCPRCERDHKEPHCADGREWGPFDAATGTKRKASDD